MDEKGRYHTLNKPFSDERCGALLMEAGALLSILPPPPAKVLECGCGSGWLSYFLAKRGYDTTGVDISEEAIRLAKTCPYFQECPSPCFLVSDFDDLPFRDQFDAVIFFAALHHCLDTEKVLASVYLALKPGGICLASEPGLGHHRASRKVFEEFDVTDRDMPPAAAIKIGKRVGFRGGRIYQHADQIASALYCQPTYKWRRILFKLPFGALAALVFSMVFYKRYNGIVKLIK